ncbi:MAG: DNA polymerase III subunit beta [Ignavibacteria bacterium]|nr:MAG: DNA polymerase III subunit beta [Ignavibacteria bacterium]
MKFTAVSSDLHKALSKIISVVPSKSTLPVLENILFELTGNDLRLTASDLEISMAVSMQVEGEADGKVAVPAKKLNETLRALTTRDMTFTADDASNRITLKTDQGEYKMAGESASNFPEAEAVQEEFSLQLDPDLLRGIIARTVYAVSTDDLRPSMMGVLFQWKGEEFFAVATDGHRLVRIKHAGVLAEANTEGNRDVIIPAKALNIVSKSLGDGEVNVVFGRTNVRFTFGEMSLLSRIIDERYPNYESVIPLDNDKQLTVSRLALISAVQRCSIFSNAITNQIRFSVSKEELRVSAEDVDFGGEAREAVPGAFSADDDLEIGFNARYVNEALQHLSSEEVDFYFSAPTRAGLIQPKEQKDDLEILMLVMPLRLNA